MDATLEELGRQGAQAGPPVLALEGVTKRWRGAATRVLDDVSLRLEAGEAIGIVGRNGAGKTTLLRIVAGALEPDAGAVRVCGLEALPRRPEVQRRIGVCAAGNAGLHGRLGARAHLELWGALALLPKTRCTQRVAAVEAAFALGELGNRRADRLSMGQRQRLRLAGAFLHEPDLLLLDEPRNSLDAESWEMVADAIAQARARGAGVAVCYPTGEDDPLPLDRRVEVRDGKAVAA